MTRRCGLVTYGVGTMGVGLAHLFWTSGWDVTCIGRRQSSIDTAKDHLGTLEQRAGASATPTSEVEGRRPITFSMELDEGLDSADLIIETIAEVLDDKVKLLEFVGLNAQPTACITSNTSSLSLDVLSASVSYPERFAGFHFFNPPELVQLVEIIKAPVTSEETIARLRTYAKDIGKVPVEVDVAIKGFVANRLQYALLREAYALVEGGVCSAEDVDRAIVHGLGARWAAVGPFQSMDLAGLDVHLAVSRELFPELSNSTDVPAMLSRLVDDGNLGVKSGRGLLGMYDDGAREALAVRRQAILEWLSSFNRN